MGAIFRDSGVPIFLAPGPTFSFYEVAEIAARAPISYEAARADMRARRLILGEAWYRRNEELAAQAWQRHRPWWL